MKSDRDRKAIREFGTLLRHFEKAKARRGRHPVADGFNWDAIFCVRDILRELPAIYLSDPRPLPPEEFIEILRSEYASSADLRIYRSRRKKIALFQRAYRRLVLRAAEIAGRTTDELLRKIRERSNRINRYNRVTGDAATLIAERMARASKTLSTDEVNEMFRHFVEEQLLRPESLPADPPSKQRRRNGKTDRLLQAMREMVKKYRSSV